MKLAKNGLVNNMDLFTYLMAKNNQNTQKDLFSYLLGKNAGGSGTYTTFSGITLNIASTLRAKIKNFMLNSTELTQDGTPSPDNPVDVNVITGDNNIKVENKNLFNLTEDDFNNGETVGAGKKIILTLKPNTNYTLSSNAPGSSSETNIWFNGGSSATNGVFNGTSKTFSTDSNGNIYISIRTNQISNIFANYWIQLEEGSTATEYVEHQEQNYPITLDDLEYCKIGDYAEQIFKNTTNSPYYDNTLIENEWYLKKMIGKVVLDGTQTITYEKLGSYDVFKYNATDMELANLGFGFSNYYINLRKVSSSSDGAVRFGWGSTIIYFYNDVSRFNGSIDNFKTWLSTHNTEVYYQLETPTYIHISESDYPTLKSELDNLYNNAKSYDGTTNITQTNDDLPFNLSVDVKVANL